MNPFHYQATKRLLQATFSPQSYRLILAKYQRGQIVTCFSADLAGPEYWSVLPTYLVARCPFCASTYTSAIDTHSLTGWAPHPEDYRSVYDDGHQQIGCDHFVGVQTFVNLLGQMPVELSYYSSHLDVPFVTPTLIPFDLPTVAVMHSLPICRIERDEFMPRYVVYMITYYALEPLALRVRRRAENEATVANDATFHPTLLYTNNEAAAHPETFDLARWVSHNKLKWLDLSSPELLLKDGPAYDFPYTNIEGYRRHFVYRDGDIEVYH